MTSHCCGASRGRRGPRLSELCLQVRSPSPVKSKEEHAEAGQMQSNEGEIDRPSGSGRRILQARVQG